MYMKFAGAETELSKERHTLYNLSHRHMDFVFAPTWVATQVHTVQNLLCMDTDVRCEHNCVS